MNQLTFRVFNNFGETAARALCVWGRRRQQWGFCPTQPASKPSRKFKSKAGLSDTDSDRLTGAALISSHLPERAGQAAFDDFQTIRRAHAIFV
jgi:hypothetical protein